MIPVIELLRVSTDLQASGQNLPAQHGVNLRTCAQYDLEVVETVEIVESGAEVARSPKMLQLLGAIEAGRVRGVVLAEYSRLFRPERYTDLAVLQTFVDYGAQIYLPAGPLDLQNEAGFVQATVFNMTAALERRRIRERMHRGKEELRRRGGNVHPIALPFGVTHSTETGWTYTDDIRTVVKVFALFLSGENNMAEIGRQCGIARTKALYILQNPIYTGWRVYDEKRDQTPKGKYAGKGYRKTTTRAADEIIRVRLPLEPVVSEETFARVQSLLAERKSAVRRPRTADPLRYLYRGHAFCTCGQQLYGVVASSAKRPYYVCKARSHRRPAAATCDNPFMERDRLEAVLDSVIRDRLLDPDVLAPAIEAYNDAVARDTRAPDHDAVRARVVELERKRARVIEAFVDSAIGAAERDTRLKAIDLELLTARQQLGAVITPPKVLGVEEIHAIVQAFATWAVKGRGDKYDVLKALRPTFHVHSYDVHGVSLPVEAVGYGHSFVANKSGLYIPLVAA